jgi:hypothetical protein
MNYTHPRITVKKFRIENAKSQSKKLTRKSKNMLKSKKLQSLNDYLDIVASNYISDYSSIGDLVRTIDTDKTNKVHLDWCLAHLSRAMLDVHKTIKNIQARLREIDANTKIQD